MEGSMRSHISCLVVLSLIGLQGCSADGYERADDEFSNESPELKARTPSRCKEHQDNKHCPPPPTAIAIPLGQIPPSEGSPPWEEPERLLVVVSNSPLSCADPFGGLDCREWRVGFSLPPELQLPGTLPLADERIRSYTSESWPNIDSRDCWSGLGAPAPGTVEIQSISNEGLRLTLTGTASPYFDASGVYDVTRCP
jgi:hypothetical protein